MNKQELQNKIEDLEKQLAEVKEQVNSIEFEGIKNNVRFRADYGMPYCFINNEGMISMGIEQHRPLDDFRYNSGNYFETERQAKDFRENTLAKQALKDLALELNNGVEIDWKSGEQDKHYLYLDHQTNALNMYWVRTEQDNNIYCLNAEFLVIAKDRIGEEKLVKLLNSGI